MLKLNATDVVNLIILKSNQINLVTEMYHVAQIKLNPLLREKVFLQNCIGLIQGCQYSTIIRQLNLAVSLQINGKS